LKSKRAPFFAMCDMHFNIDDFDGLKAREARFARLCRRFAASHPHGSALPSSTPTFISPRFV
jgi:hypothetical protein